MNAHMIDFDLPELNVQRIEKTGTYEFSDGVLVNLSDEDLTFFDDVIPSKRSKAVQNVCLNDIDDALFFQWKQGNPVHDTHFVGAEALKRNWISLYDLTNDSFLKDAHLWRSPQYSITKDIDINLWFAPAGAYCKIHNTHDFKEVHTQVFGLGIMQKFKEQDYHTKYEDILMPYGYTHEPFYNDHKEYPWHQYEAVSDCIWLAIEFDRQNKHE